MQKRSRSFMMLCIVLLASAAPALASGFRLPDQGAAAMGMAGAVAGQADEARKAEAELRERMREVIELVERLSERAAKP